VRRAEHVDLLDQAVDGRTSDLGREFERAQNRRGLRCLAPRAQAGLEQVGIQPQVAVQEENQWRANPVQCTIPRHGGPPPRPAYERDPKP
jgi:hypothetical protein